jgi:hypothetical protein
MPMPRASRARLVWALELSLGLELYACAVLALHARGLRATPLEASPALVLPALVIPPVFYVLVALVTVRPLSLAPVVGAVATMCGLHGLLVAATGALFMIPDLLDYGAAVAFALWGSPAVTLLQLTAAPLVFARLRPLILAPRPPRAESRANVTQRRVEAPASPGAPRPLADAAAPPPHAIVPSLWVAKPRELVAAVPAQLRPPAAPPVLPAPATGSPFRSGAGLSAVSATPSSQPTILPPPAPAPARSIAPPSPAVASPPPQKASTAPAPLPPAAPTPPPSAPAASAGPKPNARPPSAPPSRPALDWTEPTIRVPFIRIADQLPVEMFSRGREGLKDTLRPGVSLLVPRKLLLPHLREGLAPVKWEVVADQFPLDELALTHEEIAERLPDGSLLLPLDEVVPQIPPELLTLSTPPADVHGIEEFPAPFQPPVPASEPVLAETAQKIEPELTEVEEVEDELEGAVENSETAEPTVPSGPGTDSAYEHGRSDGARRIAALLAPLLNGLEIGQRDGAGTTLVTVVAPTLSEDSVVRTAARVVPFLTDARLPEPVTQATLAAADATVILTPFGSPSAGGALLVTAVVSRASLAWLERLSRTAAREAQGEAGNGKRSRTDSDSSAGIELREASVPTAVRELAGSLTAFGPVAPTLLRDRAGALSACLFLPSSLEALPLARFARDLHAALGGAEIGRVASIILKLGARRVVLRTMDGRSGAVTMLVGGGPIDRPGLARIELDRAATRLEILVRG